MSLLSHILNFKQQNQQRDFEADQSNKRALSQVLTDRLRDPNATMDEQAAIYDHLGQIWGDGTGKGKKSGGGMLGGSPLGMLIGHLVHHDHVNSDDPNAVPAISGSILGDLDKQIPVGAVQQGTPIQRLMEAARQANEPALNSQPITSLLMHPTTDASGNPAPVTSVEAPIGPLESVKAAVLPGQLDPYQQTRRYGSMTNQELGTENAMNLFRQQSAVRAGYDKENDERTAAREAERWKSQAGIAQERAKYSIERLRFADRSKATRELDGLTEALIAKGVKPDEARMQAGTAIQQKWDDISNARKASAYYHNAQGSAVQDRIDLEADRNAQNWYALGLRGQGIQNDAIKGMNKIQEDEFKRNTQQAFSELNEIDKTLDGPNGAYLLPQQKQPLMQRKEELLQQIGEAKAAVQLQQPVSTVPQMPGPAPVPSGGGRGRGTIRGGSKGFNPRNPAGLAGIP
jgi:hypothetical protein